jgi:hypothetical protein
MTRDTYQRALEQVGRWHAEQQAPPDIDTEVTPSSRMPTVMLAQRDFSQ